MKKIATLILSVFFAGALMAQYPGSSDPYGGTYGYPTGQDDNDTDYRHRQVPAQRIQVALILDASGSMNGLIRQAKSQFWSILNELSYSYPGVPVQMEVAVYEYGSQRSRASEGYTRQLTPLTVDLDWASDMLYDIRTGGRHEYAGYAISRASRDLRWDRSPHTEKIIFIAGNETMQQGRTDFRRAIQSAHAQGITVHTIYCGDYYDGQRHGWEDAAYYGGGAFIALDQNAYDDRYHYPQDDQLWGLNTRFNATYIPYGRQGRDYCERMRRQDRHAYQYGVRYAADRAMYKAGRGYRNTSWDLVDAVYYGSVNVADIPSTDLPTEMQGMSMQQREAYIRQKGNERDQIRNQMSQLAAVRTQAIKQESSRGVAQGHSSNPGGKQARSLDQAVRQSVDKKNAVQRGSVQQAPGGSSPVSSHTGTVSHTPQGRTSGTSQSWERSRSTRSQATRQNATPSRTAPAAVSTPRSSRSAPASVSTPSRPKPVKKPAATATSPSRNSRTKVSGAIPNWKSPQQKAKTKAKAPSVSTTSKREQVIQKPKRSTSPSTVRRVRKLP